MTRLLGAATPLAVLALAGAVLLAPAAKATRGQPAKAVPFRATINGATTAMQEAANPFVGSTFDGRCSTPSAWVISFAGTGVAAHLGRFSWHSSHCTQLGTNPPATVTTSDGHFEYLTANGDVLREDYGIVRVSAPTPDTLCVDTHATFTGGTGRFTHATGQALERLCFPATSGPWLNEMQIVSNGSIAYDASDRSD